MKTDRTKLDQRLFKLAASVDRKDKNKLYDTLEEMYNIPISISADFLTGNKDFSEANTAMAFAFLTVLSEKELRKFFSDREIETYKGMKYERSELKLPLVFIVTQISDDQWIGSIDMQKLMDLNTAGLINYNPETQRPMKRIINGREVSYKISINEGAVRQIKSSMLDGNYIPDDITINMPIETTEYNYHDGKMYITELTRLDIIDGYHRFLAMARIHNEDPSFNCPMELRLTAFSQEKAQQLIYQKDQKTQMTKDESASFNQYDNGNIICQRLNEDPGFNLQGKVTRNGNIRQKDLAALINIFYYKGVGKKEKDNKRLLINIKNDLKKRFNVLTEEIPEYFEKVYSGMDLYCIIFAFSHTEDVIQSAKDADFLVKEMEGKVISKYGMTSRKLHNEVEEIYNRRS